MPTRQQVYPSRGERASGPRCRRNEDEAEQHGDAGKRGDRSQQRRHDEAQSRQAGYDPERVQRRVRRLATTDPTRVGCAVMRSAPVAVLCASLAGAVLVGGAAHANDRSKALRRQAFHEVYSLDHDAAVATARLADSGRSRRPWRPSRPGRHPLAESALSARQHHRRRLRWLDDEPEHQGPGAAARVCRRVPREHQPGAGPR